MAMDFAMAPQDPIDAALDEALEETFPAGDPPAVSADRVQAARRETQHSRDVLAETLRGRMPMVCKSMRIVAVAGLSALFGCAGLGREARMRPVERLDEHGVSAPLLKVETGDILRFVNLDTRSHQIYSNDCAELSSTVLNPGDTYAVGIGVGPKVCHFQDLLAPLSVGYHGTLQVHDEEQERRLEAEEGRDPSDEETE